MIYDVKTLTEANNIKISDVYGVRAYFSDSAAGVVEQGAGGGFIFSSKSNNWNQKQWCNGCGESEIHDIQYDAATKSITRLEETPFWTDVDVSDAEGEYAQIAFCEWWGGDIDFSKIVLLDKDGKEIEGTDVNPGGNSVDLSAYDATEVTLAGNGKAKVDTGKVRVNVNNPWGEDVDKLITPADFEGVDAIAVTAEFDAITDPVDFAINFAIFSDNGPQYWGEGNAANKGCSTEAVTVNADGSYTFLLKFDEPLTVDGDLFLDLQSAFEAATDDDIPFAAKVTSVKALTLKDAPASSESTADSTESTDSTDSDESKVILVDSTDSKTNSAATSSKAANNASNTNPSTGAAALAAVGVALAGAAVVATKKRK